MFNLARMSCSKYLTDSFNVHYEYEVSSSEWPQFVHSIKTILPSAVQAQAQLEAELALFSFDPAPHPHPPPPVKVYLAANINQVVTNIQC